VRMGFRCFQKADSQSNGTRLTRGGRTGGRLASTLCRTISLAPFNLPLAVGLAFSSIGVTNRVLSFAMSGPLVALKRSWPRTLTQSWILLVPRGSERWATSLDVANTFVTSVWSLGPLVVGLIQWTASLHLTPCSPSRGVPWAGDGLRIAVPPAAVEQLQRRDQCARNLGLPRQQPSMIHLTGLPQPAADSNVTATPGWSELRASPPRWLEEARLALGHVTKPRPGSIPARGAPSGTAGDWAAPFGRQLQRLAGRHAHAQEGVRYPDSASARARSSAAPSPLQALPCIQASVVGLVEASLSRISRAFLVCEK
jgi:hypothetical protein